jgi:phosphocarrier protein
MKAMDNAMQKIVTIVNKLGLHARAAAKFVTLSSEFDCEVMLARGGRKVNAKSIMGVMMLAAGKGTDLELTTEGPDEAEAMERLEALIADRFGEDE